MKSFKALAIAFWNVCKQLPGFMTDMIVRWMNEKVERLDYFTNRHERREAEYNAEMDVVIPEPTQIIKFEGSLVKDWQRVGEIVTKSYEDIDAND